MFVYDVVAHKIDQSMWHTIDSTGRSNPQAARLFAIPAAIETFAKDLFYSPACIMETVFTCTLFAGKVLTFQTNGTLRHWMWIDARNMCYHSFKCALFLPISPFYATVDAIKTLWSVAKSPAKAGKVQAAKVELNHFIYELLTTYETASKDTIYLPFFKKDMPLGLYPTCVGIGDFVRGAFERFKQTVSATQNDAAVANLHFIDTEESKQLLTAEVVEKCTKINDAFWNAYSRERKKVVDDKEASHQEKEIAYEELNTLWLGFQKSVVQATHEELASLKFEPKAEALLRRLP